MENLKEIFASVAAIGAAVMSITQWLKSIIHLQGIWAQALSWIISFFLCFAGWFVGLGILAGISVWDVVFIAVSIGLGSNGFFKAIKNISR